MSRLLNFDIAKAICIVLVVIGHFFPTNSPLWYSHFHSLIYTFHMPLFLFASGFICLTYKKNESYSSFIGKKIKRLMVPYFTTSIIIITIKLLTQRNLLVENPATPFSYIKMFYQPEAGYFLWFVWSLFSMFLLIPLLRTRTSRTIVFLFSVLIHYLPFELTDIFALNETKRMFIWFMLGIFCCDFQINKLLDKIKWGKFVLYFFLIATFLIFCVTDVSKYILFLPWLGISTTMITASLIEFFSEKHPSLRVFTILSSSSYIIYLFHTTFEGFAKSIVCKFGESFTSSNAGFALTALIVIMSGVIGPILLHRFVLTRHTILKFLFGLK